MEKTAFPPLNLCARSRHAQAYGPVCTVSNVGINKKNIGFRTHRFPRIPRYEGNLPPVDFITNVICEYKHCKSFYPLIAPPTTPRVSCRWKEKYTTMVGAVAITKAASCHPSCVPVKLENEYTPTGRDLVASELASTSTIKNSFQIPNALMIPTVTITGLHIGVMMLRKLLKVLAPSILADSIRLLGSPRMN